MNPQTIERYGQTSEAVAWKMALGALKDSDAPVWADPTGSLLRALAARGPRLNNGHFMRATVSSWVY
uniref:hypothetical protein n=1 Tax=Pseudomonas capeferrum TaxID=1495066 RepID=UPI00397BC400